ncbi:MAG: lysoplasmalogenase [Lachnospiraceae bacterium]|nr:lysoplasmalogenase [Lachnospiraceae bacterium]
MFTIIFLEFVFVIILIIAELKKQNIKTLIFKTLSSLMFVLLGYQKLFFNMSAPSPIFFGLCFGAVGDVLLAICLISKRYEKVFFAFGGIMFFIGHIFYLMAAVTISHHVLMAFAISIIMNYLLMAFLFKKINLEYKFKIPGMVYVFLVIFMSSNGLVNLTTIPGIKTFLFGTGAVLFMISDILLITERFIEEKSIYTTGVLMSYYIGQTLIALSI